MKKLIAVMIGIGMVAIAEGAVTITDVASHAVPGLVDEINTSIGQIETALNNVSELATNNITKVHLKASDFGDFTAALGGNCTLDNNVVTVDKIATNTITAVKLAAADWGDVSIALGGAATVDNVAAANVAAGQLNAAMTFGSYAPVVGQSSAKWQIQKFSGSNTQVITFSPTFVGAPTVVVGATESATLVPWVSSVTGTNATLNGDAAGDGTKIINGFAIGITP
ncbi:MAG: hypothetical protein ABFD59_08340 [Smithella sp.]